MSRYTSEKAWSDFRVGLMTFLGLVFLVGGVVLAGGDKGVLFHDTSLVRARLFDVGGLKKGASVTMGGMTIGRVTDIAFVEGDGLNQIEVVMEIRSDTRGRVKTDSVPAVRTQGMLGDRYIDLSMGSSEAEELPEGKILRGDTASDFDKTLRQANEVLTESEKLLSAVNDQQGTAGRLVYDENLYNSLTGLTQELRDLILDFKKHPKKYVKLSIF